jgi:HK97 family phage major capsid protein
MDIAVQNDPTARQLFDKRQIRIAEAKAILDAAKAATRGLSDTEAREYDRLNGEIDALGARLTDAKNAYLAQLAHGTGRSGGRNGSLGIFAGEEFRALAGGSGAGSYNAPQEDSDNFFDQLIAKSAAFKSGITVIGTERGSLRVPRILADPAASWTSEAGTITPADANYDEVVATPRKLATIQVVSNELINDSNPKILELLQMQLARSLALKFDLGFFEGSGSAPEILGLKGVSGINTAGSFTGNGSSAGGATNLDMFADAIGQLAQDNAAADVVVMHPRTWRQLLKLKEQASGNNKPLLQDSAGSGADAVKRSVYGLPVLLSSQLSVAETTGTSTDTSSVYVYQANSIVAVRRMDLRIEIDRSRLFNSDQSEVRAILRIDVVHPTPKAINRISGIRA